MAGKKTLQPLPIHPDHGLHTDYLCMMIPLIAWPTFLYGLRPLVVCLTAMVTARICDRIASWLRSRRFDPSENSSIAQALLLAMLMPASVPYYVVAVSVAFSVLLAKEAFGGYGAYPFHPTAVGYAVAAVSWPQYLFRYPTPFQGKLPLWGSLESISYSQGLSSAMRAGGVPNVTDMDLLLGNYPSLLGTAPVLIILGCGLFLLARRRINLWVPLSFLAGAAFIAWCFPRIDNAQGWLWQDAAQRLVSLRFELFSGGMLFAAVFLSCEPGTCPKNRISRLVYGLVWGILTMMYRYYGNYDTGVCFALLVMNTSSGYIDRIVSRLVTNRKGVRRNVG